LLELGNMFEAGFVACVERADDESAAEAHTRDALEDDVPDECSDKDQGHGTTAIPPRMHCE
jgi:hypothetical protein